MNCTVLCADSSCKYNSGGGYYGICKHHIINEPMYTGGIDRSLVNSCSLRETEDDRIIITGGGRSVGKTFFAEALKKVFEEGQNDRTEAD